MIIFINSYAAFENKETIYKIMRMKAMNFLYLTTLMFISLKCI